MFTCLLDVAGSVYTFGMGGDGQLGHGDTADRESPRMVQALAGQPVKTVAAGVMIGVVLCGCACVLMGRCVWFCRLRPCGGDPVLGPRVRVGQQHRRCVESSRLRSCVLVSSGLRLLVCVCVLPFAGQLGMGHTRTLNRPELVTSWCDCPIVHAAAAETGTVFLSKDGIGYRAGRFPYIPSSVRGEPATPQVPTLSSRSRRVCIQSCVSVCLCKTQQPLAARARAQ